MCVFVCVLVSGSFTIFTSRMLLLRTSVYSDLFWAALQLTFVCFCQVLQQWCQRAEDIFNSEYTIYTTWTFISTCIFSEWVHVSFKVLFIYSIDTLSIPEQICRANSFSFKPNLIFIHSAKDDVFPSPINFNKSPLKNSCYDYITNSGVHSVNQAIN